MQLFFPDRGIGDRAPDRGIGDRARGGDSAAGPAGLGRILRPVPTDWQNFQDSGCDTGVAITVLFTETAES